MESAAAIYLFPVPMGDVAPSEVLPQSNLRLIGSIRHFVVENIRSARRFLKAVDSTININELHFTELSEHTPASEVEKMLSPIAQGFSIGVISEAGCPAVADPGADLVALAQRRGIRVVPLVGPSSIIMSLMASGFNGQSFVFRGYLPAESSARVNTLRRIEREIRQDRRTQIFIETPYRNNRLIDDILRTLPPNFLLCVAADITGPNERIVTLTIEQWRKRNYDYAKIPAIFLLYS